MTQLEQQLLKMDGSEVLQVDGYLQDFVNVIKDRWSDFKWILGKVVNELGGIFNFSDRSNYGMFVQVAGKNYSLTEYDTVPLNGEQPYLVYREWVGNAKKIAIIGEFNNWNNAANYSEHQEFGIHTIRIPFVKVGSKWECPIKEGQKYKVYILTHQNTELYRQPLYCNNMIYFEDVKGLEPVFKTTNKFVFANPQPDTTRVLRIYETHIGMSSEEGKINSYRDFTDNILPRIKAKNYNAIQIMAVQEHAYYASFGYQVTSFFAACSKYGPYEDFKRLVDTAHGMGILVFLDLVHSHASKNETDGLANYDGSNFIFLEGDHPLWDSKVFDYKHIECLRYLLQNVRFWLDEFNVDGFRFDGCMSMMYWHRSAGVGYTGRYGEYFEGNHQVDVGAMSYLRLAHLLFEIYKEKSGKKIITIAEDVSGYPCLASPLLKGGMGFDYRFQMAVPDMWVKMMKKGFDEGLCDGTDLINTGHILHLLTNRRHQEKHIAYAECHDQALVGDKTLLMWLLNEKIYDDMSSLNEQQPRTKRGIALHKLIRLATITLAGEGYLCFMGNEFGHPEWIDFPRAGNNWNFHCCRRQWHLEDQQHTRFHQLGEFDRKLMKLSDVYQWNQAREYCTRHDSGDKTMCYERGNVFIALSFNYGNLKQVVCPVRSAGKYKLVLNTEAKEFGGFQDIAWQEENYKELHSVNYQKMEEWQKQKLNGFQDAIIVDLFCRQALVFEVVRD